MNKKSGALFAVFCDDENASTRQRQQGTNAASTSCSHGSSSKKSHNLRQPSSSSLSSAALSAKDNRSRAPVLSNKENAKAGSSSLSGKKVFGGLEPFSHASSVAPGSLEEKQQALGYFGPPGATSTSSKQQPSRQGSGFKVLSTDDMNKLSLHSSGDPIKKSVSSASGNGKGGCGRGLGESRLQQRAGKAIQLEGVCHLQHGEGAPPETPSDDSVLAQARESPQALANISEAFSGQGGFHYSPSGVRSIFSLSFSCMHVLTKVLHFLAGHIRRHHGHTSGTHPRAPRCP